MPLNQSEAGEIARAFLRCYGSDFHWCARTLRFLTDYTNGKVNLLSAVSNEALTWQPFIDMGMDLNSRNWWVSELQRIYNGTDTT